MAESTRSGKLGKWQRHARLLLCLSLAFALLSSVGGCTRRFFRNRADSEVNDLLAEKDQYAFWKIEHFHVYPNPKARFADPTDPDHPTMPPDDPATWKLAPRPQQPGKAGVANIEGDGYVKLLQAWDQENRAKRAEAGTTGPSLGEAPQGDTPEALSVEPGSQAAQQQQSSDDCNPAPGPFLITLDQAAEMGLINSREYQGRREDLYLTALPVTLQRFSFVAQWFVAEQAIRQWSGAQSSAGSQNRWIANSGVGGFSKLFSTGALLVVRAANQTVWNMTGGLSHGLASTSSINLDFVQPFLRGGGRAVTLEPLTQAERNLVYEIRSFARFRKQFYTYIVGGVTVFTPATAGGDLTNRSVPTGSFGGQSAPAIIPTPTGLIGTQGLVGGGIVPSPIAPQFSPGVSGLLNLSNSFAPTSQGYLPTLLSAAKLSNDRKNVLALQRALKLFEGFEEGGDVSPLQVSLVKLQLLNGINTVLGDAQTLRSNLDQLKLQMGIPANFLLELDDSPVRSINRHLRRYESVLNQFDKVVKFLQIQDQLPPAEIRNLLRKIVTSDALVEGTTFQKVILGKWEEWRALPNEQAFLKKVLQLKKDRQLLLNAKTDAEVAKVPFPPESAQRLREVEFQLRLGDLEGTARTYEKQAWLKLPKDANGKTTLQDRQRLPVFRALVNSFVLVLVEARNERLTLLRAAWPDAPGADMEGVDLLKEDLEKAQGLVIRSALDNRLDVMNQRAQLADSWRQLRVFANGLLGTFNVGYHMDTTSVGRASPLAFSADSTNNQLYFTMEPPLVRIQQRNNYRASLIAYQRERRYLMSVEDTVAANVRAEIRQLRLLWQNYKIQQQAVDLAYQQVESALETFAAPPGAGTATGAAGNAAALTTQYLNSQTNLVNAQNTLYTIWVGYLIARQTLYLDLELMPIDFRGVWTNEFASADQSRPADGAGPERQPGPGGQPEDVPAPRLLPPTDGRPLE